MFFISRTIEVMEEDHKKLKIEIEILKDAILSMRERRSAFERLIPNLVSHTTREEKAVYSYMKASKNKDLKQMGFKGEQEHRIVDNLVKTMKSNKISTDEWSAQAKVLAELIENHVNEEESEVFPTLKKHLDNDTDIEIYRKYEMLVPPTNSAHP